MLFSTHLILLTVIEPNVEFLNVKHVTLYVYDQYCPVICREDSWKKKSVHLLKLTCAMNEGTNRLAHDLRACCYHGTTNTQQSSSSLSFLTSSSNLIPDSGWRASPVLVKS